jgi:hypothetical protein
MATFTERQEFQIQVEPPFSILQCRRADIVEKDGVEISRTYHRHVCMPGDDVSGECQELQAVAAALWTPEVIAAYQDSQAAKQGMVRARNADGTFMADDPSTADVNEAWVQP